jgi:Arm DNA-binding domain
MSADVRWCKSIAIENNALHAIRIRRWQRVSIDRTALSGAPPQKKTVRLFDGRGLYLEIAPTGSRWWRFKYRFAGKEKRISLGVYPDVGLKKARDRRDEMRKLVADGINPSAARKQEKHTALDAALNTFEAVAREWFEKYSPNWEASYSKKVLARLEANIFP